MINKQTRSAQLNDLATAHRLLVHQGVLDTFGHVSIRDPDQSDRFWLARALPPNRVVPSAFISFGLDGEPVAPTQEPLFSERYIHSEIYALRSDVHSVCHHHAPALLPFCLAPIPLTAVSQTGAFLGKETPVWDSADEFGPTRMLVDTPDQAASLARALGDRSLVLMRGHGATIAGRNIKDVVFKSIYACRDADAHLSAAALGPVKPLSDGEIEKAQVPADTALSRGWDFWTQELAAFPEEDKGTSA
ncbi:MAG: class II aldolase/adducin family protein [Hyphomicrobiaceae bacterium]